MAATSKFSSPSSFPITIVASLTCRLVLVGCGVVYLTSLLKKFLSASIHAIRNCSKDETNMGKTRRPKLSLRLPFAIFINSNSLIGCPRREQSRLNGWKKLSTLSPGCCFLSMRFLVASRYDFG